MHRPQSRTSYLSTVWILLAIAILLACRTAAGAQLRREVFKQATAALLWPGASRSFLVTQDGSLDNGEWITRLGISCDSVSAGAAPAITFDGDDLPIAHWERRNGDVRWHFEAVSLPAFGDSDLVVSIQVSASNHGKQGHEAAIRATLEHSPGLFLAPDADSSSTTSFAWGPAYTSGRVHGYCLLQKVGCLALGSWYLAPGDCVSTRFIIPAYAVKPELLVEWAKTGHSVRVAEARRYWAARLERGVQLTLGDPGVESAFRSSVIILLGCTEFHDGRFIPIGNPFQYRDVWLRDGSRSATALAIAGQTETARKLASGFLAYQWPQGPFLSQRGQLDGTGEAIWALEQTMLRPQPDSNIVRFADRSLAAWRWAEVQRTCATLLGLPFRGVMPYCEPRDNELPQGRGQLIGTDAWTIRGYQATARLLASAGRVREAQSVLQSRSSYVAVLQSTLIHSGSQDIPPVWQGGGRDWGNLSVVYPCAALSASNPRGQALRDRLHRDSPAPGLVRCGGGDTLHTYLSADLGTWALLAHRPLEADQVLSALIRWRTASGGSPEMFSLRKRDFGNNLPPHATAAAAIVTLIRNCLIYDDDDTLRLTLGVRKSWWAGASVRRAPTRWGYINLKFHRKRQFAEWTWSPVPVPTAVSLPVGACAILPAHSPKAIALQPSVVLVPPGTGHIRIRLGVQSTDSRN